ncbi:hypothetical protein MHA_0720 [Mannheimia haemolytica PHL213]|nr:hypothetical protein MHA_0720 [Mannheimia haemolytica PHL213]
MVEITQSDTKDSVGSGIIKTVRDVIFQSPIKQSEIATASGQIGQEICKFC